MGLSSGGGSSAVSASTTTTLTGVLKGDGANVGAYTAIQAADALATKGADIASATTTDLSAATGDYVDVTGTTTITGFGTCTAGVERTVRFTGSLTLTHNVTSLILPGAANITTAANDRAVLRSLGSGNWLCVTYAKASGVAVVSSGITQIVGVGPAGTGTFKSTPLITTASGELDNWNPGTYRHIFMNPGGTANLNGMVAGEDGEERYLHNIHATNTVNIYSSAGSSSSANQFIALPATMQMVGGEYRCLRVVYDGTVSKWRVFRST